MGFLLLRGNSAQSKKKKHGGGGSLIPGEVPFGLDLASPLVAVACEEPEAPFFGCLATLPTRKELIQRLPHLCCEEHARGKNLPHLKKAPLGLLRTPPAQPRPARREAKSWRSDDAQAKIGTRNHINNYGKKMLNP